MLNDDLLTQIDSKLQDEATSAYESLTSTSLTEMHDSEEIAKEVQGDTTGKASMVATKIPPLILFPMMKSHPQSGIFFFSQINK